MRKMRCDEFQSSLMDFSLYLLIEINFTLKLKNVVEFSLGTKNYGNRRKTFEV